MSRIDYTQPPYIILSQIDSMFSPIMDMLDKATEFKYSSASNHTKFTQKLTEARKKLKGDAKRTLNDIETIIDNFYFDLFQYRKKIDHSEIVPLLKEVYHENQLVYQLINEFKAFIIEIHLRLKEKEDIRPVVDELAFSLNNLQNRWDNSSFINKFQKQFCFCVPFD